MVREKMEEGNSCLVCGDPQKLNWKETCLIFGLLRSMYLICLRYV
jgi:hypothetical protein